MKKEDSRQKLDKLIGLARRASESVPPSIRPGFAVRVARARMDAEDSAARQGVDLHGFRWAILAFAAVTILVAAVNAPSVTIKKFSYGAAYESHVLKRVLLRDQ
ncbi:MAG: hypothetical protein O3C21_15000 [Verrucomicrobia bacterium]|nr:hypothetical protein [Verrucomicrobiota bacterium]